MRESFRSPATLGTQVFTFKGLERTPAKHIVRSLEYTAPAILGEANPALTPLERARTVGQSATCEISPLYACANGDARKAEYS